MDKLNKGAVTKDKIVRTAAKLFIKNGYNASGLNEVIATAEVSKGSFYFYFDSKKDLAIAVHHYLKNRTIDVLVELARSKTWGEFLSALTTWIKEATHKNKNYGCYIAVLGTETAFVEPELAQLYYETLLDGVEAFKLAFLNSGYTESEAASKAEVAFSIYEGYMLRFRLSKNSDEIDKMYVALLSL